MPSPTLIHGLDGLRSLVGQPLGVSDWKHLTDEDIRRFAESSGDFQWIHLDRERCARESPYKVPVAHGNYSFSRIGGLFFEAVTLQGFALVINYGANKVRFPAPLKSGARYRLSLKLEALKDIPQGVEAVLLAHLENRRRDQARLRRGDRLPLHDGLSRNRGSPARSGSGSPLARGLSVHGLSVRTGPTHLRGGQFNPGKGRHPSCPRSKPRPSLD